MEKISSPELTNNVKEKIQNLSFEERQRLLKHIQKKETLSKPSIPIVPHSLNNKFPVSCSQEQLWILEKTAMDSTAYTVSIAFKINGKLNKTILRSSLKLLSNRHAILRTVFIKGKNHLFQKILRTEKIDVNVSHISNETPIHPLLTQENNIPFNIEKPPLFRVRVFETPTISYLLLSFHHIIIDGWSIGIFMKELADIYSKKTHKEKQTLLPLQIQYKDYALWQQTTLKKLIDNNSQFWKRKLGDNLPQLILFGDYTYPAIKSNKGNSFYFSLPKRLSKQISNFGKEQAITPFTVLLTSYCILLYKNSLQKTIIIGTPLANRQFKECESIIGPFINALPIKFDIKESKRIHELLSEAKTTVQEAFTHQQIPFTKLVDTLNPTRHTNYSPIFQTMITYHNEYNSIENIDSLEMRPIKIKKETSILDLHLEILKDKDHFLCHFEYSTDIFKPSTIKKLTTQYKHIVEQIISDPSQRIQDISVLPEKEKEKILYKFNPQTSEYPSYKTMYNIFEEKSAKYPTHTAIVFKEKKITYATLLDKINILASYIYSQNKITPLSNIAILMDRSEWMIIALLACQKIGIPYIPLDLSHPYQRNALILEDAQTSLILTLCEHEKSIQTSYSPFLKRCSLMSIDTLTQSDTNIPTQEINPKSIAYIIYTSGSTGKPKGVSISYQALSNVVYSFKKSLKLTQHDHWLTITTLSFDISALEIYTPLVCGAYTIIASKEEVQNSQYLAKLIDKHQFTIFQATPTTWKMLLESQWEGKKNLTLLSGGEPLPSSVAKSLLPKCKTLYNVYGPTETTIWSTMTKITNSKHITIGKPIHNTTCYILDPQLNLVPEGIVGELFIGGSGIANGYYNNAKLTKEKFIDSPFVSSEKVFRTGDFAKWLPNGDILFLGRQDTQIKLNGNRIELKEIEAIIDTHKKIKTTKVLFMKIKQVHKIICFYTLQQDNNILFSTKILKNHLKLYLPSHMIPSIYIEIDTFPLTENGKINTKALHERINTLPLYSRDNSESKKPTPLQSKIRDIWKHTLAIQNDYDISLDDNFFDIGGTSFLSIQVTNKLNSKFKINMPIHNIFTHPTVKSLSEKIEGYLSESSPTKKNKNPLPITLDKHICTHSQYNIHDYSYNNILLTGATGFFGGFILYDLLNKTTSSIYCLIRPSENQETLFEKLKSSLKKKNLWSEQFKSRLHIIPGDISKPNLGLRKKTFSQLEKTIDIIIHNGAWVNFTLPYEILKTSNVDSTHDILKLAAAKKIKPVFFISTLGVCNLANNKKTTPYHENQFTTDYKQLFGGYAQTKGASEQLLKIAQNRHLPVSIIRLGTITGANNPFFFDKTDFFHQFLKGCLSIKAIPDLDLKIDMIPVDTASHIVTHIIKTKTSINQNFHITCTKKLSYNVFYNYLQEFGFKLKALPFQSWQKKIQHSKEKHSFDALKPSLLPPLDNAPITLIESFTRKYTGVYKTKNTENSLKNTSINLPLINKKILKKYINQLIHTGFIDI